ncbi:hypothetical protein [Xanthomonas hortorum]|uniref:hypothetical protein n=1 Tax=Xanthomonas hortorum TaxID=56454 RepID=UPI001F353E6D|nr:hypothetical protein [Xanthomonas hortorum]MCE4364359.1 hypothetical protein [Xanthomonas hortorum]
MRFLFVYVTQAGKARDLVKSLGVTDIEVIVVRKKEDYPNCEEINKIGKDQPSAAICQVVRAYKRNITSIVNIEFETNTFRVDDQRLKAWLSPPKSKIVHVVPAPSQVLS